MVKRLLTKGLLAGAGLALLAASAQAQQSDLPSAIELDYQIWTGGLQAVSLETRLVRGLKDYQVDVAARTEGMIGRLFPFKMTARTSGERDAEAAGGLQPQRYGVRSKWRDQDRRVHIRYGKQGQPLIKVDPPAAEDDRDEVPPEQIIGALDPMSAVVSLMEQVTASGRCEGEVAIFDGRRRYDMVVRHIGAAVLEPNDYSPYAGPATECRAGLRPVSGFWRDPKKRESSYNEVKVYIAPVFEGLPAVPVRLEAKREFIGVRIHMTDARLSNGVVPAGLDF